MLSKQNIISKKEILSIKSGLEKIKTFHNGEAQNTHRPKNIFHYIQYDELKPDFLIDISKFI